MPTKCLEIRTEKVLIKGKPSLHRLYFLPISRYFFVLQRDICFCSIYVWHYLWFIIYVEYNYDNVIMWKPCSLILTIPPHLNDFRFMEILTESVRPLQPSSISVEMEMQRSPPSPASSASYISKVSSPDGFSIHGLWSVTKFKFTKLVWR